MRPYRARQFVGDQRLERRIAWAQRRSGQRQAAAHDVEDRDRRLGPALHRDRDMAAVLGQALEIARQIVAADHVEHRGDALAAGDLLHARDEILGFVVDRVRRPQPQRLRAFVGRPGGHDDVDAEDAAQRNRRRADPAGPAMHQHGVALGRIGALEQIGPHGEQGFGNRRRLDHRQAVRHRQALARIDRDIFGIAAARQQCADRLAQLLVADILADRDDRAGNLQPRNRRRARRRRIAALTLQHVRPVHPGGGDADQHFTGAWARHRPLDRYEHVRPARRIRVDRQHRIWKCHHLP